MNSLLPEEPRGLPLLALCLLFLTAFWPTAGVQGFDGNLNINTGTTVQLKLLPFIGEDRAAAIVRARQKNGPFHDTSQIRQAAGISLNSYQAIVPHLSLTGDTTSATTDRTIKGDATRDKSSPSRIPIRNLGRFPVHDNELLLLLDKDYFPTLIGALKNARSEITVAMFLFKTSNSAKNRPAKVLAALAAARKRGVRVEVLLEKSFYDDELNRENKKAARLLKRKGILVRFDRGRVTTHTKLVIVDRRYSFIGSHNLTQAALGYNHEASLFIDNRELAEKLLRYITGL